MNQGAFLSQLASLYADLKVFAALKGNAQRLSTPYKEIIDIARVATKKRASGWCKKVPEYYQDPAYSFLLLLLFFHDDIIKDWPWSVSPFVDLKLAEEATSNIYTLLFRNHSLLPLLFPQPDEETAHPYWSKNCEPMLVFLAELYSRIERKHWMPAAVILSILRPYNSLFRESVDRHLAHYTPLKSIPKKRKKALENSKVLFGNRSHVQEIQLPVTPSPQAEKVDPSAELSTEEKEELLGVINEKASIHTYRHNLFLHILRAIWSPSHQAPLYQELIRGAGPKGALIVRDPSCQSALFLGIWHVIYTFAAHPSLQATSESSWLQDWWEYVQEQLFQPEQAGRVQLQMGLFRLWCMHIDRKDVYQQRLFTWLQKDIPSEPLLTFDAIASFIRRRTALSQPSVYETLQQVYADSSFVCFPASRLEVRLVSFVEELK